MLMFCLGALVATILYEVSIGRYHARVVKRIIELEKSNAGY